ncbi:MAG: HYR domain-containing protein, partial [Myxococcaceae bacterium]
VLDQGGAARGAVALPQLHARRAVGNTLYFAADDGASGMELWKSDGTAGGTTLVKDIRPGAGSSSPAELTALGGVLYLVANDGNQGAGLWRSNGTAAGTTRVVPSAVGPHYSPELLKAVGDTLFFSMSDPVHGQELWKSDGTSEGTTLVRDLLAGEGNGQPAQLTALGSWLYFVANDGTHGRELWRSDGTVAGTTLVRDIRAGASGSGVATLTPVGPVLLFSADDGASGVELWKSDGTDTGTRLVVDLVSGPTGSQIQVLGMVGDQVYFRASDGRQGDELFTAFTASFGDCTPPGLVCSSDVTAEAAAATGAAVSYTPAQGSDDSGAPPQLSYSQVSGERFPLGDTPVVVTARDAAGNTETCSFLVKVRDTTPPELTCPPSQEVAASSARGAEVQYPAAQSTDAVSTVALAYSPPSGSTFPVGQTSVELTATDVAGNSSRCSFQVKVVPQASEGGSGCGCHSGGAAEAAGWLLLAMAPLLLRRRREASPSARQG